MKTIDPVIGGEGSATPFELKVHPDDFGKVNQILSRSIKINLNDLDKDYYLFSFSDEELKEILYKQDEWSMHDYLLAKEILKERGIIVSEIDLQKLNETRLAELARPEKEGKAWKYAGYFFALFGGLFGVFIGLALWKSKKTLPNGDRVFIYDEGTRKSGKTIFYLAIIVFIISLIFNLSNAHMYYLDLFWVR